MSGQTHILLDARDATSTGEGIRHGRWNRGKKSKIKIFLFVHEQNSHHLRRDISTLQVPYSRIVLYQRSKSATPTSPRSKAYRTLFTGTNNSHTKMSYTWGEGTAVKVFHWGWEMRSPHLKSGTHKKLIFREYGKRNKVVSSHVIFRSKNCRWTGKLWSDRSSCQLSLLTVKSRPIRSELLFSTTLFRSKKSRAKTRS